MNKRFIIKRCIAIALSIILFIPGVPMKAYAAPVDSNADNESTSVSGNDDSVKTDNTEETSETGTETSTEAGNEESTEATTEQSTEENAKEHPEEGSEESTENTSVSENDSIENLRENLTENEEDKDASEKIFVVEGTTTTYVPDPSDIPDNDELLNDYLENQIEEQIKENEENEGKISSPALKAAVPRYTALNMSSNDRNAYFYIKDKIEKVAKGEISSTVFEIPVSVITGGQISFTAEELGVDTLIENNAIAKEAVQAFVEKTTFDAQTVHNALLVDCPFSLFWYDKTTGWATTTPGFTCDGKSIYYVSPEDKITLFMYVSPDYAEDSVKKTTDIDITQINRVNSAVGNAQSVVDEAKNSNSTDYGKLVYYRDWICDEVSYNDDAAKEDYSGGYGDPWQLIWAFDKDPETKIVCEGYSKALKLLCDLSQFDSDDTGCYLVSGYLIYVGGYGGHMWNILRMDDGKYYLADVTNYDSDNGYYRSKLFLGGYTAREAEDTYDFNYGNGTLRYQYDPETINMYTSDELAISDKDYDPPVPTFITVSFITNTDQTIADQVFSVDSFVTEPQISQRDGYEFNGWYTSETTQNEETIWDFSTRMVSESLTLYAGWSPNTYTLSFDANGGNTDVSEKSIIFDSKYGTLPTPIRSGYSFSGWYTSKGGGTKISDASVVSTPENHTLYAHWTQNKYSIAFNGNGNTSGEMQDLQCTYDTLVSIPGCDYAKTGNSFTEWNTSADGTGTAYKEGDKVKNLITDADGEVTLYAQWSPASYIVSFNANGGSVDTDSKTVIFDGTYGDLPTPVRTGYTFGGWYTAKSGGNRIMDTSKVETAGNQTLYARWSTNRYTVVYSGNGNTSGSMENIEYDYETQYHIPSCDYIRTGYTFTKWNTKADGSGTSYASTDIFKNLTSENNGMVTLYAQWRLNEYTVEFNGNGNTSGQMQDLQCTYDSAFIVPENKFTRAGYTFSGWNTRADGSGTGYTPGANAKNLTAEDGGKATLYAQWTPNSYTVIFDGNGSTSGQMQDLQCTYDSSFSIPDNTFIRTGYTFVGWNSRPDGSGTDHTPAESVKNLTTVSDGTVTLYAKWSQDSYTVRFNGNGSTSGQMQDKACVYDDEFYLPDCAFEKTGYTFAGWNTKADRTGNAYGANAEVKNLTDEKNGTVTLYAQWTPNSYTVIFNGNGSTSGQMQDLSCTYDSSLSIPDNQFTRTGYTFTGWNTKADGSGTDYTPADSVKNLTTVSDGTVTLYAKWSQDGYTVRFNGNGSTSGQMQDKECVYDDEFNIPDCAFEKTGYTFAGWNTKADKTGTAYDVNEEVKNLTDEKNGTVILYAQWTPNSYTVKFNGNGSTSGQVQDLQCTYDSSFSVPGNKFIRTGYTFTGWNTKADGSGTDYTPAESVKNLTTVSGGTVTLYAKWSQDSYTVRFNGNGSTSGQMQETECVYDVEFNMPDCAYEKTGYTFAGWNTKADKSGITYEANAKAKNLTDEKNGTVTLYAQWTPNSYTVKFNGNGSTSGQMQDLQCTYDSSLSIPESKFIRTGYTFTGWNTKADGSGTGYASGDSVNNLTTVPYGTVTLYANWGADGYTVSLDANGGTVEPSSLVVEFNSSYGNMPVPVRDGYTFDGWYTASASGSRVSSTTPVKVAAGHTLYAHWKANSYKIHYDGNGATKGSLSDTSCIYDRNATLATSPFVRTGYTFGGWNTKADGSGTTYAARATVKNLTTEPNGIATLYVKWDPIRYTVKYDGNGATSGTMPTHTYVYDTSEKFDANRFEKTGYTFAGWKSVKNSEDALYADEADVPNLTSKAGSTIILYAHWMKNSYSISFDANTGSGTMTGVDLSYDTPEDLPANSFTKTGYSFNGWNTAPDGSGDAYADQAKVSNLTSAPNETVVFYAQWKANKYPVSFDTNGGEMAEFIKSVEYDSTYGEMPVPTRNGYSFDGWYTQAEGGDKIDAETTVTITSGQKLYAHWISGTYKIQYNGNGSTAGTMADETKTFGISGQLTKNSYERTGHTFAGWNTAADGSGTAYADEAVITDPVGSVGDTCILYAQWSKKEYTVKYVSAEEATEREIAANSVEYGDKAEKPSDPERTGYRFDGWYKDNDFLQKYDFDTAITEDIIIHAKWVREWTVTFRMDGGSVYQMDSVVYKIEDDEDPEVSQSVKSELSAKYGIPFDESGLTYVPTRTKYVFAGWYDSATGGSVFDFEAPIVSDVDIYARWTPNYPAAAPNASIQSSDQEFTDNDRRILYETAVVELRSDTRDSKIYYTTDGSDPTDSSNQGRIRYTDGIRISGIPAEQHMSEDENGLAYDPGRYGVKIKAYTVNEGHADSEVMEKVYAVAAEDSLWGDVTEEDRAAYQTPADVPTGLWMSALDPDGYDYIGAARKFTFEDGRDVRVYYGKTLLVYGKDYSVAYGNNVNAYAYTAGDAEYNERKAPILTVTAKGNYAGKISQTFKINRLDMSTVPVAESDKGIGITNPDIYLIANNKVQKPGNTVRYTYETGTTATLRNGSDYTLAYPGTDSKVADYDANAFKAAGNYTVTINGKGNYTGTNTYQVHIEPTGACLMSSLGYSIGNTGYLTRANAPAFTVKKGRTVLENGREITQETADSVSSYAGLFESGNPGEGYDYVYYISNNTQIGNANITFIGNETRGYAGIVTKTYKITGSTINTSNITMRSADGGIYTFGKFPYPDHVYNGTSQRQSDEGRLIFNKTTELAEGTDYRVEYSAEPINAGTYTVRYIGMGAYTGTISRQYKITAYNLSNDAKLDEPLVSVGLPADIVYSKGGAKPVPTVTFNSTGMAEGSDYTCAYKNNTKVYGLREQDAGFKANQAPAITIKGKGNFTGTKVVYYTIASRNMDDNTLSSERLSIVASDRLYTNKKGNYTTEIVVTDTDGKNLTAGTDYYKSNDKTNPFRYYYIEETAMADGTTRDEGSEVLSTDCVPAGTVLKVAVTLKGNYSGIVEDTFRIYGNDISKASVRIEKQYYTGKAVYLDKDDIVVTLGKTVLSAQDYKIVSYANNVNKGTAKVTINGVGDYGGTKTLNFSIVVRPVGYNIRFNSNGATSGSVKDMSLTAGRNYKLNANSYKRNGYNFTGWNTRSDGSGTDYADKQTGITTDNVTDNLLVLYAMWEPVTYTITYHTNGGPNNDLNTRNSYISGDEDIAIYAPARETWPLGYQFGGWYTDNAYKNRISVIRACSTGNYDLYAKWIPYNYTVEFDINVSDEEIDSKTASGTMGAETFSYGITKALNANRFKRKGYVFMGWSEDPDATEPTYLDKQSVLNAAEVCNNHSSKITLYAVWDDHFDILYELSGGDWTYDGEDNVTTPGYINSYTYGQACSLPVPLRDGYTFDGWYTDQTLKKRISSISKTTYGNMLLYARWKGKGYKVKYDSNAPEGTKVSGKMGVQSLVYGTEKALSKCSFVIPGYVFKGWSTGRDATTPEYINEQKVDGHIFGNYGDQTLYAVWESVDYKIEYITNGGMLDITDPNYRLTYSYDAVNPYELPTPVKDRYVFDGWYSDAACRRRVSSIAKGSYKDMTLYAKWKMSSDVNEFYISYDLNGGDWTYDEAGNISTPDYRVAYTYNRSSTYKLPIPVRDGYTFGGWYTDSTLKNKLGSIPRGARADYMLYARWIGKQYKITFDPDAGYTGKRVNGRMSAETLNYGSMKALNKNAFSISGYTFMGWSTVPYAERTDPNADYAEYDNAEKIDGERLALSGGHAGSYVLYAVWNRNDYSITYMNVEGMDNSQNPASYNVDTATIELTEPEYMGDTFLGWYSDSGLRKRIYKIDQGSVGDRTIYAKWSKTKYTINYNLNCPKDQTAVMDMSKTGYLTSYAGDTENGYLLPTATRDGYRFVGWYSSASGGKQVGPIIQSPTVDMTVYARWEPYTYTVRFNPDPPAGATEAGYQTKGTMKNMTGLKNDVSYTLNANAYSIAGYTFAGWSETPEGEVAYTNRSKIRYRRSEQGETIDLYAKWTPVNYGIKYTLNGGTYTEAHADTYTITDTIELADPERSGYTFAGWYMDSRFSASKKISAIPTGTIGNISLYAKWTKQ